MAGNDTRDALPPGVIVAGGLARRMGGGDKGLLVLGQGTVLAAVVARLAPQVSRLALNANGDAARFAVLGLPVLPDPVENRPGPLAGILVAMEWAASLGCSQVLTVPGDAPFLPADLVARLMSAGGPAVAASAGRTHPVVGLWPTALAEGLRRDLAGGLRRVEAFAQVHGAAIVEFVVSPDGFDPFLNLNTPEDFESAERWI